MQIDLPVGNTTTPIILCNTLHMPGMAFTIVSIDCIIKAGHSVTFKSKNCKIMNSVGKLIGNISASSNSLYKVKHTHRASATSAVD